MYQPGGATLAFGGPVELHAARPARDVGRFMKRWSMSMLCVTEPMRTSDDRADARRVGRVDRERLAVVDACRARR